MNRNDVILSIIAGCSTLLAALVVLAYPRDAAQNAAVAISQMDRDEQLALAKQQAEFERLHPHDQQHMREVYQTLAKEKELLTLAQEFRTWFRTLPDDKQEAFKKCSDNAGRIDFIRKEFALAAAEIAKAEAAKLAAEKKKPQHVGPPIKRFVEQLSSQDIDALYAGMKNVAMQHRRRISEMLPKERLQRLEALPEEKQLSLVMFMMLSKRSALEGMNPMREELPRIAENLTPASRQRLDALEHSERNPVMLASIMEAFWRKTFPEATPEKMELFASGMPEEKRKQLEQLTPEERQREIRTMYIHTQFNERFGSSWEADMEIPFKRPGFLPRFPEGKMGERPNFPPRRPGPTGGPESGPPPGEPREPPPKDGF
jgi:hypothetical protein